MYCFSSFLCVTAKVWETCLPRPFWLIWISFSSEEFDGCQPACAWAAQGLFTAVRQQKNIISPARPEPQALLTPAFLTKMYRLLIGRMRCVPAYMSSSRFIRNGGPAENHHVACAAWTTRLGSKGRTKILEGGVVKGDPPGKGDASSPRL